MAIQGRSFPAKAILIGPRAKPRFIPANVRRAREELVRSPIVVLSRKINARMPRFGTGAGHVTLIGPRAKPRFQPAVPRRAREEIVVSFAANQKARRLRQTGQGGLPAKAIRMRKLGFAPLAPRLAERIIVAALQSRLMAIAKRRLGWFTFPTSTKRYLPSPRPFFTPATPRLDVHIRVTTFASLLKAIQIRKPRTGLGRSTLTGPRAKPRFQPAIPLTARHVNVHTYGTQQQVQRSRLLGRWRAAKAFLFTRGKGVTPPVPHPHFKVVSQAIQRSLYVRSRGRGIAERTMSWRKTAHPQFFPAIGRLAVHIGVASYAARDKALRTRQMGRSGLAAKAITLHIRPRFQPAVPVLARHLNIFTVAGVQAGMRARILGRRLAAKAMLVKARRVYVPAKVAPQSRSIFAANQFARRYRIPGRATASKGRLFTSSPKPRNVPAVARTLVHIAVKTYAASQQAVRARIVGRLRAAHAVLVKAKRVFIPTKPTDAQTIIAVTYGARDKALRLRTLGRGYRAKAIIAKAKRIFYPTRPTDAQTIIAVSLQAQLSRLAARIPGRRFPSTPHLVSPRPKGRFTPAVARFARHVQATTFGSLQAALRARAPGRGRPAKSIRFAHRGLIAATARLARHVAVTSFASVQKALRQRLTHQHGHVERVVAVSYGPAVVVPAASVVISPSAATIPVGGSQQLTVQVFDANGNLLPNAPVSLASSNSQSAFVTSTGLVVWVGGGSTMIVAVSGSAAGVALITTQVETYDTTTTNPNVAIGSSNGQITRVGPGNATITFSLKGNPSVTGTVNVSFT